MQTPESNSPLAIVGIGCLFPKAAGPGYFWANVKHGIDCITEVPPTHWDPADYFDADPKAPDMTYARRGGFLDVVDFNPLEFGIAPRDIEATDTTQLLGLVAAKQALTDAGVVLASRERERPEQAPPVAHAPGSPKSVDRSRVSVILGVTGTLELVIPLGARLGHPKWKKAMKAAGVPDEQIEDAAARIAESYVPWQENSFPGLLGNVVAGRIANRLDLQGTNCVVDAACASSLSAVHLAAMELQTGRADVVVTGGADTFNDIFMYMCFSKTPALSPTGDARPFDANGDGTILGEGLGVVVLKRLADAEAAGDTIYAVIKGIGSSSDGKGNAIYAPSAEGQRRCLLNAYRAAGVTPETIELVEAHGTGTRVGDATEATALTSVFTEDFRLQISDLRLNDAGEAGEASVNRQSTITNLKSRPWCALGSVKSQIGHTKAAAGSASLIKVALALHHKVLPPTLKVAYPVEPLADPDSPFYVNTTMRPWLPRAEHPRRAALSAFGFGGSNFHAVLEEHTPAKLSPDWDGSVEITALSADTPQQLAAELARVPTDDWAAFARFAEASRGSFDHAAPCRLTFAAHRTLTDLPKLIAGANARLAAEPDAAGWHTPEGAHFGRGPAPGPLAVLFPGQGSQAVGMLRDLACLFPELLDSLAAADAVVAAENTSHSRRLSDVIYPTTSFDSAAKDLQDAELRATQNAQPALGAVSFGAWRVLSERFGVTAGMFAGHSYGELVALAAAGRLPPGELFTYSRLRGRLMGEQRAGDPGGMLAVLASAEAVQSVLTEHNLDLVLANRNGPRQTVVSGPTAEITRASEVFSQAGLNAVQLPVAAAFHSPLVADAAGPFLSGLAGAAFAPGSAPVFANTTAAEYPTDPAAARDLLAHQLAKPVGFVDEVLAMARAGARTFLEVGPGTVLTKLVGAILSEAGVQGAEAVALDGSGSKRSGVLDLAHSLARLAARGHRVGLSAWEEGSACRPAPMPVGRRGMTIPLTGANYVAPRPPRPPVAPIPSGNGRPAPITNGAPHSPPTAVLRPTNGRPAPALAPKVTGMPDTDPNALAQALQVTQQSLAALQRMQEQTAALHKQFLDSQEAAHRTVQTLVEQQQALLFAGLGSGAAPPALPQRPPLPVPPPPAPTPPATPAAPAAPVAVRPPAPVPAAKPAAGHDAIASVLLAVVSEKTGYPADSLKLGLSLDADLGVDSIKRVEILSALQERLPDSPQVKPEHLGALHSLQDVADFLAASPTPPPVWSGASGDDEEVTTTKPMTKEQLLDLARSVVPDVASVLLAVVSEKTGYPADSLNLGLSLDADLGVDSIKRVEILSALQERLPDAPQVRPEHLGALHSLQDVADFLAASRGPATAKIPILPLDQTAVAPNEVAPETEKLSTARTPTVPESVPNKKPSEVQRVPGARPVVDAAPRPSGVVTDRIDRSILQAVDLDMGTPRTRAVLPPGGEFWVVGPEGDLTRPVADLLAGLGFAARALAWGEPPPGKAAEPLAGLLLIAPTAPGPESGLNRRALEWVKAAGPRLRHAGRAGGAVLVTVTRLDGAFGLAELPADADPTAGGLTGLAKTARHEWPEVHCKAVDLAPEFAGPGAAEALVDEALCVGPVEVGVAPTHRCTLELARTVRRPASQLINLGPRDVILVTGGARGVTAEAAVALAETYTPTLILTGRTPPPAAEPDWLSGVTGEAELKKVIADRLGPDGGPRQVGELYRKVVAQREIRRTLDRVTRAGGRAVYFPVDTTDGRAVADMLQQVRVKYGPVTALVHGAGVLADKRIEDLTAEQFDLVYDTKVTGLRNLLELLAHDDLKALVLFSSTTARFGRTGQAAYACANEVLNKTAQVEARRRPGCRVVSINWGPWDGGMVTPGLRKVFESEGVGLIPLPEGSSFLVQELSAAGKAVEVIALGKHRGGSGVIPVPAGVSAAAPTPNPLTGPPAAAVEMTQAFERVVDAASHPVLRAHVIDGKAVLPLALHLEWLAHAALHGNPGLVFHGFNDLRVTSGVQVEGAPVQIRAMAGKAVKQDRTFVVPVELRGRRKDGREVTHSRAEIVLAATLPPAPPADRPPAVEPFPRSVADAYREFLFHGPELHGIEAVAGASESALVGTAFPAPPPAEWLQFPLRSGWVADPLVLDASFQMMILWTQTRHGAGSLPCFAGRYRQYRKGFPAASTTVVIRVRRDDGKFARADIDYLDPDGRVVAQMQDYECLMEKTLNQAFRKNQLVKQ